MSRMHRSDHKLGATSRSKLRRRVIRHMRWGIANASFVALGGGILCAMFAIAALAPLGSTASAAGTGGGTPTTGAPQRPILTGHGTPSIGGPQGTTPSGQPGTIQATCDGPGLPACAPIESWIPLRSASSTDIIAAAKQSTLFHVDRSGPGDHLNDISRLGVPQLVRALHVAGKANAPDYYVIPIEDTSGQTVGSAELQLDTAHTAVMVAAIITYVKPYAANSITWMTSDAAVAAVQTQHHVSLHAGILPRLVYYPGDSDAQQTGKAPRVSGQSPAEPVWAVPGTDGQDHIVATDGNVYRPSELPMAVA